MKVFNPQGISFHLSLSLSVAKQMAYLYPRFYNCSVPSAFSADLPQLSQLCEGTKAQLTLEKRVEPLLSARGEKFISFAKSEQFVDGKIFHVQFYQMWPRGDVFTYQELLCNTNNSWQVNRYSHFLFSPQFSILRGFKAEEYHGNTGIEQSAT